MTENLSKISQKVGFIGAGNMASALIRGLVQAGLNPQQLFATDLDSSKLATLKGELGIQTVDNGTALVEQCDVVLLAMKPNGLAKFAEAHQKFSEGRLWISVAAGVTTDQIEQALAGKARVVRAMPNTPALVGEGSTGLAAGSHLVDGDIELASQLLGAVGITAVISEGNMDALTGLSGSGPAYVMLIVEAMADGAVRAGLPRDIALRFAAQTVRGASTMVLETGKHPGELKDMVTSPGGTTICGVAALEQNGLRNAMISAVLAAAEQSRKLSGK